MVIFVLKITGFWLITGQPGGQKSQKRFDD